MTEILSDKAAAHAIPSGEGAVVLEVSAQDPRTVLVRGGGTEYMMVETYEHHTEVVTVYRAGASLARLELHDIRASKISVGGAPLVPLKDWLHRTPVNAHNFPVEGVEGRFEWRAAWHGLRHQLELFAPHHTDPIAFAYKGHHAPHTHHDAEEAHAHGVLSGVEATLVLTPKAVEHQDLVVLTYLLIDRRTRPDPLQG
ncbi:hypothetical protein AURDEDRAFT_163428 [Auricularia subglabra TFB-10046 SS5]|nr:hypothetical protein AURDEDRAFT_163428 [Auricularia subglabra TFB-10046 SS5]